MVFCMNIAYANLSQADKTDFGKYTSNKKLRDFFNYLYAQNKDIFIEKDSYAYMKLGFNDSAGNPLYAYFVPNAPDKKQKWKLQGSRTEKEISELENVTVVSEKIPDILETGFKEPAFIPKRNKPDKVYELDPGKKNAKPKIVSSLDMISVNGEGTIKPFQIGQYTVVQKLYKEVMGNNPAYFNDGAEDTRPVENISWEDAVKFCNELSIRQQLQPVYILKDDSWSMDIHANGYRLPTREEWLFAANGGSNTMTFDYSGSNNIQKVAWWQGDNPTSTHDVGDKRKQPNKLGLYDMSGNVWEWCWHNGEHVHICCGGAYNSSEDELRLASSKNIKKVNLSVKDRTIGFRLVKSNEEKMV